jgi:polar amino acid transport system substrate-binding protein
VNARSRLTSRPGPRALMLVLVTLGLALGAATAAAAPGQPAAVRAARAPGTVSTHGAGHATAGCNPEASSLSPSGPPQVTPGSFMTKIRDRGYLIAGVSQSSYHFGFFNPLTGQIEGFDIDMIRAVATAIFGDADPAHLHFKAITDKQRIPDIQNGTVDIVAETMSILCSRLKYVDFSSVYFDAGQRVLVLKNSPVRNLAALRGQKVCATAGADSLGPIKAAGAIAVPVAQWTDCLMLLQQGDVAAISTDDSILDGLKAQDPLTKLVGPRLTSEFYGLAISKQHPDFVRFVNAVLQQLRTDGQWAASYARWIGTPVPKPPPAQYAG